MNRLNKFQAALSVVVLSIGVLAGSALSGTDQNQQTLLAQQVIDLERRVAVLEQLAIVPSDIPVYVGAGDPNQILTHYDKYDIVPMTQGVTLDLVCDIYPTQLQGAGEVDGLETLRCMRYTRLQPFGP